MARNTAALARAESNVATCKTKLAEAKKREFDTKFAMYKASNADLPRATAQHKDAIKATGTAQRNLDRATRFAERMRRRTK